MPGAAPASRDKGRPAVTPAVSLLVGRATSGTCCCRRGRSLQSAHSEMGTRTFPARSQSPSGQTSQVTKDRIKDDRGTVQSLQHSSRPARSSSGPAGGQECVLVVFKSGIWVFFFKQTVFFPDFIVP